MRWKDEETGEHNDFVEGVESVGTWRYESINSMKHVTLSRRDDILSILYMIVFFLKGNLPW